MINLVNKKIIIGILLCAISCCTLHTRSPLRTINSDNASIITYWDHNPKQVHKLIDSHLQEALLKLFEKDFFFDNLLPTGSINYRYQPTSSVSTSTLSTIIEYLLSEIKQLKKRQKKITFKDFTILKKKDVNKRNHTGLFVLEFKDYPFILKLFIETPESIVAPLDKGFEPLCFHYLSGLSRHFNGFTRIKNLHNIKNIIESDTHWTSQVDYPRKWFWLPKKSEWITIESNNIGLSKQKTKIPAIYGIICDKIIWQKPFVLSNKKDRKEALSLCNFLGQRIDSHINNFGREIQSNKIVPIDFEHFITATGIPENLICINYTDWYLSLTTKALKQLFFRNKYERKQDQSRPFKQLA